MKLGLAFSLVVAILLISAVVFSTNFIPSQDKVFTKDKLEVFLKRNNADEEIASFVDNKWGNLAK